MNVDTQFPHSHTAAMPARPPQSKAEQVSSRPVEQPHHDEPSNNQTNRDVNQTETRKETRRPEGESRTIRQESELSQEEKRELDKLKARDREVRARGLASRLGRLGSAAPRGVPLRGNRV